MMIIDKKVKKETKEMRKRKKKGKNEEKINVRGRERKE